MKNYFLAFCLAVATALAASAVDLPENGVQHSTDQACACVSQGLDAQAARQWQLAHPDIPLPEVKVTAPRFADVPAKEDAATYSVTPVLTSDPEKEIQPGMYQFAFPVGKSVKELKMAYYFGMMIPFSLPAGTYDFVFFIDAPDGKHVVTRKNVEVNSDMEIEADISEATNHVEFSPVFRNGDRLVPETWVETPSGEWEQFEKGNFVYASMETGFYREGHQYMSYFNNLVAREVTEDGEIITNAPLMSVWVEPDSEVKFFQIISAAQEKEGVSLIIMAPENAGTQTVSNSQYDFLPALTAKVQKSRFEFDEATMGHPSIDALGNASGGYLKKFDSKYLGGFFWRLCGTSADMLTYNVCNSPVLKEMTLLPQMLSVEVYLEYLEQYEKEKVPMGYAFPATEYVNGEWVYVAAHQPRGTAGCQPLEEMSYNENIEYVADGNPAFGYPASLDPVFGDNTPTVFLAAYNDFQFDYAFVGRYGETRGIDFVNSTLDLKVNGETSCERHSDLNDFFQSDKGKIQGSREITIFNDNVEVDGLRGSNTFNIVFPDGFRSRTPAIVQMQLRDDTGNVTDRFDTAAEGNLNFSAGDYVANLNEKWQRYYTWEEPRTVKVEYAPYDSGNWTEIYAEVKDNHFYMPGYGAYYTVPLDQVKSTSASGWFDVRFTVEGKDATMTQTVSPAFKIENLSGLHSVKLDESDFRVENGSVVTSDGSEVEVYDISGSHIKNRNLSSGIYIVRTACKTIKIVVR